MAINRLQLGEAYETLMDGLASRFSEVSREMRDLLADLDGQLAARRAGTARQELERTWDPGRWQERIPEILEPAPKRAWPLPLNKIKVSGVY